MHGIHLVEKFPTRLLVEDKSTSPLRLSFLGPGKDIATKGEKVQYPKALLMQMTTKPVYDERLTEGIMTANEGFDLPEEPEVAAMFLDGLWDEALEVLRTNFHGNGSNSHVVLTYPGCWNAAELSRLQTAVELSKIPKQACPTCPIEYVKEQVAATYAILAHHKAEAIELRKVSPHPLSILRDGVGWERVPGRQRAVTKMMVVGWFFHGSRLWRNDHRKCIKSRCDRKQLTPTQS